MCLIVSRSQFHYKTRVKRRFCYQAYGVLILFVAAPLDHLCKQLLPQKHEENVYVCFKACDVLILFVFAASLQNTSKTLILLQSLRCVHLACVRYFIAKHE